MVAAAPLFDTAQLTSFFEGPDFMVLSNRTGLQLVPPKLTKHYPVHKWMKLMVLYLGQKVGVCNAPLAYVVWAGAIVPAVPPPLQAGEPHSEQHGSIEGDLIGRMTRNHALFKVNNGAIYNMIESSTRGSDVTSSIAPFRKTRDG